MATIALPASGVEAVLTAFQFPMLNLTARSYKLSCHFSHIICSSKGAWGFKVMKYLAGLSTPDASQLRPQCVLGITLLQRKQNGPTFALM